MLADLAEGEDPGAVIAAALAAASDFAQDSALGEDSRARFMVVVEELIANSARHGRVGGALSVGLVIRTQGEGSIEVVLEDDGPAFDPTARTAFSGPDPETGGGVGLELVKAWAKEIRYERGGGRNRIHVVLDRALGSPA
ncbi:ATP-binding protein [Tsuneonella sp. YG55]|uniref:ATP-binding protein n=1 Tax=Tsuneonella litorea TaxID=2976475 RepID=A0A9X3A7I1_9SPHN|nr:ATP-binding protein [Tsuneonella litorea]MCT2558436.1 ATP-binding protein [Tsuneonella litorea]